jgi:hypothetical protein
VMIVKIYQIKMTKKVMMNSLVTKMEVSKAPTLT